MPPRYPLGRNCPDGRFWTVKDRQAKKLKSILFDIEQLIKLKEWAAATNSYESEIVRAALDHYFADPANKKYIHKLKPSTRVFEEREEWSDTIDAAKIDAEPEERVNHYYVGRRAWFVDNGRWFLVRILEAQNKNYVAIQSVTGWDAECIVRWKFGDEIIEFKRGKKASNLYTHLRPLEDRQP